MSHAFFPVNGNCSSVHISPVGTDDHLAEMTLAAGNSEDQRNRISPKILCVSPRAIRSKCSPSMVIILYLPNQRPHSTSTVYTAYIINRIAVKWTNLFIEFLHFSSKSNRTEWTKKSRAVVTYFGDEVFPFHCAMSIDEIAI